jgi:hypothetical protein
MDMLKMYEDRDEKAVKDIEYAKSLCELQSYNVKREQHIEKLLLEDYVRTIKSYVTRYDVFESKTFQEAQSQKNNKLKADRPQFEMMKTLIISDFLNGDKNFKLVNIISCGWEAYAWSFEFDGYKTKIYIEIPDKRKLNVENIDYANQGMFCFYVRTSEFSRELIKKSYKIEDIAEAVKEYFKL